MTEKIIVAVTSAVLSFALTYGTKVVQLEGRMDGIERALIRVENKLSQTP